MLTRHWDFVSKCVLLTNSKKAGLHLSSNAVLKLFRIRFTALREPPRS